MHIFKGKVAYSQVLINVGFALIDLGGISSLVFDHQEAIGFNNSANGQDVLRIESQRWTNAKR